MDRSHSFHNEQPRTEPKKVGGAGAALLQVECTGMSLLDWGAQALPNCADNIVAETYGAELAISLYQ